MKRPAATRRLPGGRIVTNHEGGGHDQKTHGGGGGGGGREPRGMRGAGKPMKEDTLAFRSAEKRAQRLRELPEKIEGMKEMSRKYDTPEDPHFMASVTKLQMELDELKGTGEPEFDEWMKKVDAEVGRMTGGLTSGDLVDIPYHEMFEQRKSPSMAAKKAFRESGGKRGLYG